MRLTSHFTDAEKKDTWAHVVAPATDASVALTRDARGPAPVHSPLSLYATLLSPGKALAHAAQRGKAYAHVVQTSGYNAGRAKGASVRLSVGGQELVLAEGDGVYVHLPVGSEVRVENTGEKVAEVLLFDLE
jgi:redox-sensitive bicupin YhaK (pirin superfamily)